MNLLLREWLDIKNDEFNHKGYDSKTLDALQEFANFITSKTVSVPHGQSCACDKCLVRVDNMTFKPASR